VMSMSRCVGHSLNESKCQTLSTFDFFMQADNVSSSPAQ
jgi:hypothetical protein